MTIAKLPIPADRIGSLHSDRKHILIMANPGSGATSGLARAQQLAQLLESAGWEPSFWTDPEAGKAAIEKQRELGRLRCVVAAGGDGTAAMVAQWIDSAVPLAPFPLGTENLLAKFWRIPYDIDLYLQMLAEGSCITCDAGLANGRLFLLHASIGFDADVVRLLHSQRRGHIRHWSYASPIFRSIFSYSHSTMRIATDRGETELNAKWAFVFNFPPYAMGLQIQPDAVGHDGKLNLMTFSRSNLFHGLRYFFGVLMHRHRTWRDIHEEPTTWLRLEADEPVPYQLDGDPGGFLPLEIKVLPSRLRLVVPAKSLSTQATS